MSVIAHTNFSNPAKVALVVKNPMRTKEQKKDRETRAILVLGVIAKNLEADAAAHAELKARNDLMIQTTKDVLEAS